MQQELQQLDTALRQLDSGAETGTIQETSQITARIPFR